MTHSLLPACWTPALLVLLAGTQAPARAAPQESKAVPPALPFPGLLARDEREAGNPLATYQAMLALEDDYLASSVFAPIFPEVRLNYEEFFGLPMAGLQALRLPVFRAEASRAEEAIPARFQARPALEVIEEMAVATQIVIYGEEHHLPQTRSLYEAMLRALWRHGYRYLAAETFAESVMAEGFDGARYDSGYYLMDPIYASALRTARELGYRLVAYDTSERGPDGDASFRDRTQAETLVRRIFARDPGAKVLVLAGRGHAAEVPPADGWTPMASVLKERTGIDPFTLFAPTMGSRLSREEEHPWYRDATARGLVPAPTIFHDGEAALCLGSGSFDAYVFWPRFELEQGRADWMRKTMGRLTVAIPAALLAGSGLRLAQAFRVGETERSVPVDQILLRDGEPVPALMLPRGVYWVRVIAADGSALGPVQVDV